VLEKTIGSAIAETGVLDDAAVARLCQDEAGGPASTQEIVRLAVGQAKRRIAEPDDD